MRGPSDPPLLEPHTTIAKILLQERHAGSVLQRSPAFSSVQRRRQTGQKKLVALGNERHDILQLKAETFFSCAVVATGGFYIPLSAALSAAICDVTPSDGSAEGEIVMGERAALAAVQTVLSAGVDSAAKSEAGFDMWRKKKKFRASLQSGSRRSGSGLYSRTDVLVPRVPAPSAEPIHSGRR